MMTVVNIILFAALGFTLSVSGISFDEKPLEFVIILLIVSAIDITSRIDR